MSPLPVRMILKKEVVLNSVVEFLGCWAVGERQPFLSTLRMGSPPLPSPTPSLGTQRIPFILPLLASGAAIDIVAQPGERRIASGLPATRLPEPVLHRPPLNQLQLLQPPQPLRPSGIQSGPLWTLSPSHPSMRRGRRKRIPLHPTSNLGTHLGGGRMTLTGV